MPADQKKHILILGGGTAGWVTGAVLSNGMTRHGYKVTVVDTAEIPTIGVGEASIPTIYDLLTEVGLTDQELVRDGEATFKYGIQFENWSKTGEKYMHGFGNMGHNLGDTEFFSIWASTAGYFTNRDLAPFTPTVVAAYADRFSRVLEKPANSPGHLYYPLSEVCYALHFDASLLARMLRRKALDNGVVHLSRHVVGVETNDDGIAALITEEGGTLKADFYVDCSGMRGVLSRQALNLEFEDWKTWLPCDAALAVQTERDASPLLYTQSVAHDAGWRWEIQLQHRTGNGLVYCTDYMSDDEALDLLMNQVRGRPITEPRRIPFNTGRLATPWYRNCAAIGLSAGFLEPLESTSIHLICKYARLLREAADAGELDVSRAKPFNQAWRRETSEIRDFLMAHYLVNQRPEPFWLARRNGPPTPSLAQRIDELERTGWVTLPDDALFGHDSWFQVLVGQRFGFDYSGFATDAAQAQQWVPFLGNVAQAVRSEVGKIPNSHQSMLDALRL
jgi:tryptophan halogenase